MKHKEIVKVINETWYGLTSEQKKTIEDEYKIDHDKYVEEEKLWLVKYGITREDVKNYNKMKALTHVYCPESVKAALKCQPKVPLRPFFRFHSA